MKQQAKLSHFLHMKKKCVNRDCHNKMHSFETELLLCLYLKISNVKEDHIKSKYFILGRKHAYIKLQLKNSHENCKKCVAKSTNPIHHPSPAPTTHKLTEALASNENHITIHTYIQKDFCMK